MGKLSGFYIFFPISAYSEIESMLVGKYGEPHQNKSTTAQTYGGSTVAQFIDTWNTEYGPMKLYYRYPDLKTGYLQLENTDVNRQVEQYEAQKNQEKGKSVF